MQRDVGHALASSDASQSVERAVDLAAPRHEHEDVAGRLVIDDAFDHLSRLRGDRALVRKRVIANFHRIALPFRNEDRALIQIRRDRLGIERRGHHQHGQIGPLGLLQVLHQRQRHIAEQVPLVELIEDHRTDVRQRAIILEPAQQDAFGDKADARAEAGVIVEADLIADLRAELAPALPCHARGHRAGGDAPGLQHHDHLVTRDPRIEQHLRHLRGLARPRGRDEHHAITGVQSAQDVCVDFPDRERGGGGHELRLTLWLSAGNANAKHGSSHQLWHARLEHRNASRSPQHGLRSAWANVAIGRAAPFSRFASRQSIRLMHCARFFAPGGDW